MRIHSRARAKRLRELGRDYTYVSLYMYIRTYVRTTERMYVHARKDTLREQGLANFANKASRINRELLATAPSRQFASFILQCTVC